MRFALFAVGWTFCTWNLLDAMAGAQPGGPTPVVVREVVRREVAEGKTFVGTVLPSRKSVVGSAVDGRVVEFMVNDGDRVAKDQPLARLRTTTLELEIDAAKAELQLRQYELDELKNGSRPEEIAQAKAALARSQALAKYAAASLARTEALFARGRTVTQEEVDEARSAATAAQQSQIETQALYDLAVMGPRKEKVLQAEARVAIQTAEVKRLEDEKEKYTIRSPFDGYVVAEHTEVGAWISRADSVAEIASIEPVEVTVAVPEQYVSRLDPQALATLRLEALPDRIIEKPIARIVPQADVRSRSFPVKINLENKPDKNGHPIKAGMLAQVTLAVGSSQEATLVPKDALVLGGRIPLVYVLSEHPSGQQAIANPVPVQLGISDGSYIQVSGQLEPGQQVVVRGNERLRPGTAVRVIGEGPEPTDASD
jgi:RND family efflux transporter MFP subunit